LFNDKDRYILSSYLKDKDNSFRDMKLLDGFEEKLSEQVLTKDLVYDELEKWAKQDALEDDF